MRRLAVAAVGAGLVLCGGAQAQSTTELKGALDQAMKTIQDLQARVKALEDQKAQAPAPAAPASAAAAGPVVVAPGTSADEGAKDPGQARVEVYGQVMADAIYDFKKMDPDWTATLRPSKIPICPGSAGCGKDGRFDFGIRQSSLGVRGFIPTAYGVIKTDLAFDLFGSDGSTGIHWLRAWAELGKFGVGQTDSNFMDISVFPNTIDYFGPPGMVFVRNPQVRYTPLSGDGMTMALSLEAPSSAIDTGRVTDVDPALGAGITSRNRLPDFVASFRYERDWGHVRAAGVLRQVGFQNSASPDGEPSNDKTGYGLNLSGTFKLFGKDQLNWQVVGGHAIASYMNDGGIDLAPDASSAGPDGPHARLSHLLQPRLERQVDDRHRLQRASAEQRRRPVRQRLPHRQLRLGQRAVPAVEKRDDRVPNTSGAGTRRSTARAPPIRACSGPPGCPSDRTAAD